MITTLLNIQVHMCLYVLHPKISTELYVKFSINMLNVHVLHEKFVSIMQINQMYTYLFTLHNLSSISLHEVELKSLQGLLD